MTTTTGPAVPAWHGTGLTATLRRERSRRTASSISVPVPAELDVENGQERRIGFG